LELGRALAFHERITLCPPWPAGTGWIGEEFRVGQTKRALEEILAGEVGGVGCDTLSVGACSTRQPLQPICNAAETKISVTVPIEGRIRLGRDR